MGIRKAFVVLGAASILVISGCGGKVIHSNNIVRCDHAQPKTFTVRISVSKDTTKEPKVRPESIVACFADDILFETVGSEFNFKVTFENASPFEKNLKSSKGKVKAKVKVKPRGDEEGFKYDVIVPGYPPRDPWIRIRAN